MLKTSAIAPTARGFSFCMIGEHSSASCMICRIHTSPTCMPWLLACVHLHAHKIKSKPVHCVKYFKVSMTIAVDGIDIDIGLFVNLRKFIEEECMSGLCCMEWGGALTHKHFQLIVIGNFSSLLVLNKNIKVCLGWDVSPPTGHVVSCKRLRDEGLHAFKVMIDYCTKDSGEKRFEFVHHNVSANDMNVGKLEYTKFGKVGLNNHVSFSHSSILQMVHQWACFCMKKPLGVTFLGHFVSYV